MDADLLIEKLAHGPEMVRTVTAGLNREEARWRPAAGGWSVVEVVNHLLDEETDDFRRRIEFTLLRPGQAWPSMDPERWAVERRYQERDLAESLAAYARERDTSLRWLNDLDAPDWNRGYDHPRMGRLTAADLLASWVAHDLLHVRQIVKRRFEMLAAATAPARIEYAGKW